MFIAGRTLTAKSGRMADAISLTGSVLSTLNSKMGTDYSMHVDIGGDPNAIFLTTGFETLADYEQMRMSYMADQQLMAAISMSTSFMTEMQDQIGEVLRPPGERKAFAQVHQGRLKSTGVAEGTELILELTNHVSELSGSECGLVRPVTGDQYGVSFVAHADTLQGLKDMTDSWVADEKYQELFLSLIHI